MIRRVTCFLLALLMTMGYGISALAAENDYEIYVNGVAVEHSNSVLEDGTTYVAAFFVVQAMYPDAVATWENEQTCIRAEGLTITAKPGAYYMVANGRYLYIPDKVRVHPESRNILVPVRTIAKAMGAQLHYDNAGVYLTSGTGPILSGDQYYNTEDLDLIARVIRHEAGNQSLQGKMAVGNVILNRVASVQFPNTVSGVLFQKNQFTGATNCKANEACRIAAKLCMDGGAAVPAAVCWFNGVGKAFWASRNKSLLATIGNHAFYG